MGLRPARSWAHDLARRGGPDLGGSAFAGLSFPLLVHLNYSFLFSSFALTLAALHYYPPPTKLFRFFLSRPTHLLSPSLLNVY